MLYYDCLNGPIRLIYSTFTPIYYHRKEGVNFHIALFPEVKLDFVTKLSRIHGNIMRTNQVTGNIIVSTCCLGAPKDEGVFTAISLSQTYAYCMQALGLYSYS